MAHLVFKFIAAGLIRWIVECRTGEPRILLGWKEYCKRVALTGMHGYSRVDGFEGGGIDVGMDVGLV